MVKLLLTAENFAFGPIGKLLNIAESLKTRGYHLSFAGFGTALQLAKKFPFATIHEIDTDDPKSTSELETIISDSDAVISSMDLNSVVISQRLKKPVVWVDCLFWFWDDIPKPVFEVDLFVRERSMNDSKNESKFASKIKNVYSVGPIIGTAKNKTRTNQALISFGGGEASHWYKVGKDTNYPFIMAHILSKQVDWSSFKKILLATSERIATELKKRFPLSPFEFVTLPHDQFLEEMSKSEVILITPGLITTQAAFYLGTPTIFLPPSNNSQYLQLDEFLKRDLAPAAAHLADFMPKLDLQDVPAKQSTQKILCQLRELEKSFETQKRIGKKINKLVKGREKWSHKFVVNGKNFVNSLGGNGLLPAVDRIIQLLKDKDIR